MNDKFLTIKCINKYNNCCWDRVIFRTILKIFETEKSEKEVLIEDKNIKVACGFFLNVI